MNLILGPVLGFRSVRNGTWNVSALFVVDQEDVPGLELQYQIEGGATTSVRPRRLKAQDRVEAVRFDLSVSQTAVAQTVTYGVEAHRTWAFTVPGTNTPLRLGYATCNGFSSQKLVNSVQEPYALWGLLGSQHRLNPFHLLLLGGDAVYADELLERPGVFHAWMDLSRARRLKAKFTAKMAQTAEQFYFRDLYCARWSQPDTREVLASVPTLMMWDDHDIFDGWGSYAPDLQACGVFQGLFAAARDQFRTFQQQCADGETTPGTIGSDAAFSWGYRIGDTVLLAPDLRSQRTQRVVLTPSGWDAVFRWLDQQQGARHLLFISSIPVVYANVRAIEDLLGLVPGEQELEDDLKDQWRSPSHREERLRVIHRLLGYAAREQCRVTIVSGDVHVPAYGVIESAREEHGTTNARVINQLISSAIVHPPPPSLVVALLDKVLGASAEEPDRGITCRLLPFPGASRRLQPKRNYLTLSFDETQRIWAEWWLEGEMSAFTKVVHPCRTDAPA